MKNKSKETLQELFTHSLSFETLVIESCKINPLVIRDSMLNLQISVILLQEDLEHLKGLISDQENSYSLPSSKLKNPDTELIIKACESASEVLGEFFEIHESGLH